MSTPCPNPCYHLFPTLKLLINKCSYGLWLNNSISDAGIKCDATHTLTTRSPHQKNLTDSLRWSSTKAGCCEATNTAQRNDITSLKWAPGIKVHHIQIWLRDTWHKCLLTWGTAAPHSRRAWVWETWPCCTLELCSTFRCGDSTL